MNFAAFLGWLAVSSPFLLMFGPEMVPLAMLLGLPIAFVTCWLVVAPLLWRLMRRSITWLAAVGWGAVITGLISLVGIAFGRLRGWRQSRNPNFDSQIGGGDHVQSIDGILTPYGWWVLAQNTALFILLGIVIALIVRAIIGPGRQPWPADRATPGHSEAQRPRPPSPPIMPRIVPIRRGQGPAMLGAIGARGRGGDLP